MIRKFPEEKTIKRIPSKVNNAKGKSNYSQLKVDTHFECSSFQKDSSSVRHFQSVNINSNGRRGHLMFAFKKNSISELPAQ